MDLQQLMAQYVDAEGNIALPTELTLASLAETLYQADTDTSRVVMRQWLYGEEDTFRELSRQEINTRIKAVAARLQQVAEPGTRVAILAGNSPEYLFGFLGAMYAGMTPVPLYDPNEPGHAHHLTAVFADCKPAIVLTNRVSAAAVRTYFSTERERPRVISINALPDSLAASWQPVAGKDVESTAFLQYTSGSTRTPAGVELSNRAVLVNVLQTFRAVNLQFPARVVSWLPMHHDMGIILALFTTILGIELDMMTPRDFIQHPNRWVERISRQPGDEKHTYSAVPNFALELAARYGKDADFSNVAGILIGSEPVTEPAVQKFLDTFSIERSVLRPSYGLAEATLIVATTQGEKRPLISHFNREKLAEGHAVIEEKSAATVAFTSNGQGVSFQHLAIVDPETKAEVPEATIGEIWVHGQNMATGYLNRPDETAATFRNRLGERIQDGLPEDDWWMATGDLATIIDGELYITGRLKDLIVIAGRNHYPQDIEGTVQEASAHVRPDSIAAFAVEGETSESLVLLVERADDADSSGDAAAAEAIRTAVTKNHGITPSDIVWKAPGEIKRTSSHKIARRVAKRDYQV
ncbi:FadD32-like long-chain-fatty-acid--AMP ligase [Corynebacterium macginleyi]|uniref:FadD32-like long-chain-fatty-acid--AMP ligase n=1 Tax=Corynebacterium macginleyi TaxID=38290 RepID=UPI00142DDC7D|nr:FadD32-like long-chain-fatty-acid--AMP ligase [Corynebacterium macginleyi]QRP21237.1 AMP-binding protein [Corynebacterium macginleyi]